MPVDTKRFRHSRQATEADREAAKMALERAEMRVEDAEKHLNKFSHKWSVRDCRALMAQAGMTEEEIDAVCPLYADDRVRVTLTFSRFSEDGEVASVADTTGVCADIPVSSILQDAQDSIDVGDTVPCDILREVWESSGLVADTAKSPTEDAALCAGEDGPPQDDIPEDDTPTEPPADGAPMIEAEASPDTPAETPPDTPPAAETESFETSEDIPLSMFGHNIHRRGRDIIEATLPLTNTERLELAQEMADALAERDRLESEFNAVKKDYKTRIDLQVNLAAQAGETYRAGERTQDISCEEFEDRTTGEIIWVDSVSLTVVKRRAMTAEERRPKLPGMDSYMDEAKAKKNRKKSKDETLPDLSPDTARTCITCGNRDATTDAMPDPCKTCSQIESGPTDNWSPVHECATCTHVTTRVNMPPCAGCSLNADETHRGNKEEWEWSQQTAPVAPVTNAEESIVALEDMPDMPCADDQALPEEDTALDERYIPDELDDIPADCIPPECAMDDDAMPSLPPLGDGTEVRQ